MNSASATDDALMPSTIGPDSGDKGAEVNKGSDGVKDVSEVNSTAQDKDEERNPSPAEEYEEAAAAVEVAATPSKPTTSASSPTWGDRGDALTHLVLGGDQGMSSPGADSYRCAEYDAGAAADPYATDSSDDGEIVFRSKKKTTTLEVCVATPTNGSAGAATSGTGKKTPSSTSSKKTRAERIAAVTKGRQRFSGTKSLKKILGRISPGGSSNGSNGSAKGSPPKTTGSPSTSHAVTLVPGADGSPSSSPTASEESELAIDSNPSMQSDGSGARSLSSPGSASTTSPPKSFFPEDDVACSGGLILDATTPMATPVAINTARSVDESVTKYFSSLMKTGKGKSSTGRRKSRSPPTARAILGSNSPTAEVQSAATVPSAVTTSSGMGEDQNGSPEVSKDVPHSPTGSPSPVMSSSPSAQVEAGPDVVTPAAATDAESSPTMSETCDDQLAIAEANSPEQEDVAETPRSIPSIEAAAPPDALSPSQLSESSDEKVASTEANVPEQEDVAETTRSMTSTEATVPPEALSLPLMSESNDEPLGGTEAKDLDQRETSKSPQNIHTTMAPDTCKQVADSADTVDTSPRVDMTSTAPNDEGEGPTEEAPLETPRIISPFEEQDKKVDESPEESLLVTPFEEEEGTTQTETVWDKQNPPTLPSLKKKTSTSETGIDQDSDNVPPDENNPGSNDNKDAVRSTEAASMIEDSGGPTTQLDLLSGLSNKYSPSQHMPKYSETELKAKIDAAILKAEREWMQKVKSASSGGEAQKRFDDLKNEHESEMKRLVREHEAKIQEERLMFENKTNELLSDGSLEHLQETIASLKNQIEQDKARFQSELEDQQKGHQADINDIEDMLNQVVADHDIAMVELREKLQTKDTMIDSLGKSLKEAKEKKTELERRFEENQVQMDQLRVQMEEDQKVARSLEEKMEKEKADHEARLLKEEARRMAACDETRNEMIKQAEVQFAKANEEYKRIKSKYSVSMKSVKQLESELKEAKSKSESLAQEQQVKEKKMLAEVAQFESQLATAEANTASAAKKYTLEIAEMKERERQLKIDLENAAKDREAARASLTAAAAEKQRLLKENKDMNEMCEQLLAIAEKETQ